MKRSQPLYRTGRCTGAVAFGFIALAFSTQALAGPCGHAYPVDAPTTLSKVARACGVSMSALREANPGVDPADVRPGQHVAVPPQAPRGAAASLAVATPQYAEASASGDSAGPISSHPFIVSPGYAPSRTTTSKIAPGEAPANTQRAVEATAVSAQSPLWLRTDVSDEGHYGETSRLSFQRHAAVRIRNAGFAAESPDAMVTDGVPAARFTSEAQTIDTPHNTSGYRLPDYNAIGKIPHENAAQKISFVLAGHVTGAEGGCLLLQSSDNVTWRLAAAPSAEALIGKTITAWGVRGAGASCGEGPSMLVSHTIHAEPWRQ